MNQASIISNVRTHPDSNRKNNEKNWLNATTFDKTLQMGLLELNLSDTDIITSSR